MSKTPASMFMRFVALFVTSVLVVSCAAAPGEEHNIIFGISDNEPFFLIWPVQVFVFLFKYLVVFNSKSILGKILVSITLIGIPLAYSLAIFQKITNRLIDSFMTIALLLSPVLGFIWFALLIVSMFVSPSVELFHIPNYLSQYLHSIDRPESLIEGLSTGFFAFLFIPCSYFMFPLFWLALLPKSGKNSKFPKREISKKDLARGIVSSFVQLPSTMYRLFEGSMETNREILKDLNPLYWTRKEDGKDDFM